MSNAYDDLVPDDSQIPLAPGANAYDDIVPPPKKPPPKPDPTVLDQLKHLGGMAARVGVNTVAGLPMMAEDFGVGLRNLYGKVTGGQSDFEYPSDTLRAAEDQYFGKPQGAIEKVTDAVGPIVSGVAGSKSAVPLVRALMGGAVPEADGAVPANFANPAQTKNALLAATLKKSQDAGYVIPPSTTNPTRTNRALETVAGKIATQQGAAVKNQAVTNRLASSALGLNPDAPITLEALNALRREAGQSYAAIRQLGKVVWDDTFRGALNDVKDSMTGVEQDFPGSTPSPLTKEIENLLGSAKPGAMDPVTLNRAPNSFTANNGVTKIQQLRDEADVAGRAGNKGLAKGYKDLADAVEAQIDRAAQARLDAGDKTVSPSLVENFRAARRLIAKSYSVQDALNSATGDVSATKLAASGDPLSAELKTAADFARAIPKAAQDATKIGSHGVSHLDMMGTLLSGELGEKAAGPAGVLLGAGYPLLRGAAKSYLLSAQGQRGALPAIPSAAAASDLGPTRAKAALVQALAGLDRARPFEHETPALPAY